MSRPVAVILAGGASRRFGRDKAAVEVGGVASLARVTQAARTVCGEVLVAGGAGPLPAGATERVADLAPGEGPLQAVLAAARARPGRALLVLACDMPWVTAEAVALLAAPLPDGVPARAAVLAGQPQPLAALYGPEAIHHLEAAWQAGQRGLMPALRELAYEPLTEEHLPDAAALDDFDTPEELARRQDAPLKHDPAPSPPGRGLG